VKFIFRNVPNYGYFRTGVDQYIGAIVQKTLLRWVKKKQEYNTLEIVKVKILPQKKLMFFIV
jgi:hypothetical protein